MKKQTLFLLSVIVLALLLGGCNTKKAVSEYVGGQITSMKEGNTEVFSSFLEKQILESNESFVLSFPEELKEAYLDFSQTVIQAIQFQVSSARENGDGKYTVAVTFSPLDIMTTTQDCVDSYLESMTTADLTAETSALLNICKKAVSDSPVYTQETYVSLDVTETDDGYHIDDEQTDTFLSRIFTNYMYPYTSVCEVLDARDYFTAQLDAIFKGDTARLAKHTRQSEESLLAEYESSINFSVPAQFSSAYTDRYYAALRAIIHACKYDVGIPRKTDGTSHYTVDVTATPNNSLFQAIQELGSASYTSVNSFSKSTVETLEKYAASPVYGEPTVITLSFSLYSAMSAEEEALLGLLGQTLLPGQ